MKKTIDNIQTLRGLAALSVVFLHATSSAGLGLQPSFGNFGVDIFFVISGFIISYMTSVDPRNFMIKRVVRIVPFYWMATLVLFGVGIEAPGLLHSNDIGVSLLTHSLIFVPYLHDHGSLEPLLKLGWTLNYEMYFYVIFWFSMQVNYKFRTAICCGFMLAIFFAIRLSGQKSPTIAFYADPIIFEFMLGILSFCVCEASNEFFTDLNNWSLIEYLILFVLIVSLVLCPFVERYEFASDAALTARAMHLGILAFFIVTSSVLIEQIYRIRFTNLFFEALGDASYILYLIHPYVIYGVIRILLKLLRPSSSAQEWLLLAAMLVLASAIAIALSEVFEKPVLAAFRRRLVPR